MAGILKAILFSCIFYCVAAKNLPQKCGSEDFIKPHRALCDRYYLCNDGELDIEKCPEGYLFNSSTLQCEEKENVDCGKRRIPGVSPKKNRLLEDLVDVGVVKLILDGVDLLIYCSDITLIENHMDF